MTQQLPQWLHDLAGNTPPRHLEVIRSNLADYQLARLRGRSPSAARQGLITYTESPAWIAGMITGLHGDPHREEALEALMSATSKNAPQITNSGLTLAICGWNGHEVSQTMKRLSGSTHTHATKGYNGLSDHWAMRAMLKVAWISDLLRKLAGLPTDAVQTVTASQPRVPHVQLIAKSLRSALEELDRKVPMSTEQRHTLLEYAATTTQASSSVQLRHWALLFPGSSDETDLTPTLTRAITSPKRRDTLAHTLAELNHPLATKLIRQPRRWSVSVSHGPLPTLKDTWSAKKLTPNRQQLAQTREALLSLQSHLRELLPAGSTRQTIRGTFSSACADSGLAHLLITVLAGHLSNQDSWPEQRPELTDTLRQWTALCRSLPSILGAQGTDPTVALLGKAKSHEHTLMILCAHGWPLAGLALTLTAQIGAKFAQSNAEHPVSCEKATPEDGELLLSYWEAMEVTASVMGILGDLARTHVPGFMFRLPQLTYDNNPGEEIGRSTAKRYTHAVSLALLRRAGAL